MVQRFMGIGAIVVLFVATAVFGQVEEGAIRPDNIKPLEFERPILEYICAIVFLLAALAIGFMPSKRTNN